MREEQEEAGSYLWLCLLHQKIWCSVGAWGAGVIARATEGRLTSPGSEQSGALLNKLLPCSK